MASAFSKVFKAFRVDLHAGSHHVPWVSLRCFRIGFSIPLKGLLYKRKGSTRLLGCLFHVYYDGSECNATNKTDTLE